MSDLDNRIDKIFTPDNLKALDAALDDQGPAADDQPEIIPAKKKIETRGRKNRGLTKKHYEEMKERQRTTYNEFMSIKSPDNFNPDIIERVDGEIIAGDDLESFRELYQLTIDNILDDFRQNNPELIKRHPYNWYKPLLLDIKKNVQKITADDIDKCVIVWDLLSDLLYMIGLYPTYELFQYMTGIYKYQLKSRAELSPKYMEFLKKITSDSDGALISELATSPYNSTNKIFLAKVHGIIEKTEPKQIEVTHNIQSYNNIARYRLDDQGEK